MKNYLKRKNKNYSSEPWVKKGKHINYVIDISQLNHVLSHSFQLSKQDGFNEHP